MPETRPPVKRQPTAGMKTKFRLRSQAALTSILLGTLIWIYVDSRRIVEQAVDARLEVQVPDGWEVESGLPPTVRVNIRGPRQVMSGVNVEDVRVVKILTAPTDKEQADYRPQITLTLQDIRGLPPETTVRIVKPNRLTPRITRLVKRFLPIRVITRGTPDKGYAVALTQSEPWYVEVKAPKGLIDDQDGVETEPLDLTGRTVGFSEWTQLTPFRKNGRTLLMDRQVYASVEIIEKPSTRTLKEKIPVRVLLAPEDLPGSIELKPAAVTVTVEGLIDNVASLEATDIKIYVDSREKVPVGKDTYRVTCKALPLKMARVTAIQPSQVEWIVQKKSVSRTGSPPQKNGKPSPANTAAASKRLDVKEEGK